MNDKKSKESLAAFSDKFLIVGYKPDGRKGIPVTYEVVLETANDEKTVCNKISELTAFRVFSLKEDLTTKQEWIDLMNQFRVEEIEEQERQQLQNLKDKYENK